MDADGTKPWNIYYFPGQDFAVRGYDKKVGVNFQQFGADIIRIFRLENFDWQVIFKNVFFYFRRRNNMMPSRGAVRVANNGLGNKTGGN